MTASINNHSITTVPAQISTTAASNAPNQSSKASCTNASGPPQMKAILNSAATTTTTAVEVSKQTSNRITATSEEVSGIKDPIKIVLPVFKPKNECNVIKIIQKEWDREVERLDQKKMGKRPINSNEKSIVQSGHAEIESNKVLYIYGNALEVLQRTEFYSQVEEIHLNYVRFDLIVFHANLDKLRRFTKLRKLVLSNNYLNSFILLSKIECLNTVEQLMIYDNEVLRCVSIKSFIVYRFQHIKEVSKPFHQKRTFYPQLTQIYFSFQFDSSKASPLVSKTARLPSCSSSFSIKSSRFKMSSQRSPQLMLQPPTTQRNGKNCVRRLRSMERWPGAFVRATSKMCSRKMSKCRISTTSSKLQSNRSSRRLRISCAVTSTLRLSSKRQWRLIIKELAAEIENVQSSQSISDKLDENVLKSL